MKKIAIFIFLFIPFIVKGAGMDSYTAAGSARSAETSLRISNEMILFLDPTITNLANETQKNQYKNIIIEDIKAQIYMRQFRYAKSYEVSLLVQKSLNSLYLELLDLLIKETKHLLDTFAPIVLNTPIPARNKPVYFLQMGYRDLTEAKTIKTKTDHIFPRTMYSKKLEGYMKALERLKRARKYSFYAFIFQKTPMVKRTGLDNLSFEEIGSMLWEYLGEDSYKEKRGRNISLHYDNYNRLRYPSAREHFFQGKDTREKINLDTDLNTPTGR